MNDGAKITIPYTYSVYFREEMDVAWNNRWDLYFSDQAESSWTHWLAIVNSMIISGILGAVCIVIWGRTTQGDVRGKGDGALEEARTRSRKGGSSEKKRLGLGLLEKITETANDDDLSSDDEPLEDITGWKLLHSRCFPATSVWSAVSAPHWLWHATCVHACRITCAQRSWSTESKLARWALDLSALDSSYLLEGFSGYFSSRVYKTFGGVKLAQEHVDGEQSQMQ